MIRLVLASAVILSHAFPLGGWGDDPFLRLSRGQQNFGGMAVLGFFAVSGYLITKSGLSADALQFIWRRVLRIFPAFWLVLCVGAFIVGPIAWLMVGRPLSTYFSFESGGPFHYVVLNADLTMRQWGVFDVFWATTPNGNAAGGSVFNGSLWTLSHEWAAYLIIWVLVILTALSRARWIVPLITAWFFAAQVAAEVAPGANTLILPFVTDPNRVLLTLVFLYGACLAIYADKIPFDWRLGVLSCAVVIITTFLGGLSIVGFPAIAYAVVWLAGALPKSFQWIGAKNDYSYGMYVYGYLVQQFTAFLGWYHWGYVPWVISTIVISAGCAWLSWHGVEKRALSLKNVGPGRGLVYWWRRSRDVADSRRLAKSSHAPTNPAGPPTSGSAPSPSPEPAAD